MRASSLPCQKIFSIAGPAQPECRCDRGEPIPGADAGRGEPSRCEDAAGVQPPESRLFNKLCERRCAVVRLAERRGELRLEFRLPTSAIKQASWDYARQRCEDSAHLCSDVVDVVRVVTLLTFANTGSPASARHSSAQHWRQHTAHSF